MANDVSLIRDHLSMFESARLTQARRSFQKTGERPLDTSTVNAMAKVIEAETRRTPSYEEAAGALIVYCGLDGSGDNDPRRFVSRLYRLNKRGFRLKKDGSVAPAS